MSISEYSVNGNGKLFASRRHLYEDKDFQGNNDINCKTHCAAVPRHRISGRQRMPPYAEAPSIKVPEPLRARSQSRTRSTSQPRKRAERFDNADSELRDLCLSVDNRLAVTEPLLVNEALVMVVPNSYIPSVIPTPSTSSKIMPSKDAKKEGSNASFSTDNSQFDNGSKHILAKKVPPLYIPRPCHEMEDTEWDSNVANVEASESEDENETPWGKKLAAIKVSRVKRDFDEDTISIEAPEGTLPVCARCGVAVYLAEEKRAAGRRFHITCFKCFLCSSSLDSSNMCERNQEVYCKTCYLRQFGPKGYDHGAGEGALRME